MNAGPPSELMTMMMPSRVLIGSEFGERNVTQAMQNVPFVVHLNYDLLKSKYELGGSQLICVGII